MNWTVALPELVLACAAMAILMVGVFRKDDAGFTATMLTLGALLAGGVLVLGAPSGTGFNGLWINDAFSGFNKVLILAAAALALIVSMDFNERQGIGRFEYPVLLLLSAVGALVMVSANDLMTLYLGLELMSLALYVVAAFDRDSVRSSEAGLKYFVLGALASGLLLYGMSLTYGFAGTTSFTDIARALGDVPSTGLVVGIVFVVAGLCFKISAVPFHMWTPDVYEGAPTPVTAFFSTAPKVAAIALLLRVLLDPFGAMIAQWQQLIVLVSIASMVLGALAAIRQTNIKRLMAYSSIGHVGYALIGLAAGTETGVRGVLIYMAIYVAMNAGTFACIVAMRRRGHAVERIADLAGLARSDGLMAAAFAVFMFSMAGIPPLAGFFSKLYVFLAAVEAGMWTLAVIGVVTSVVGAYYYLNIIKVMYFDAPSETTLEPRAGGVSLVIAGTGLFNVLFFLLPAPLVAAAAAAAKALFG
jgi:NADH-quinone oxidoreductase subunit N